MNAEPPGIVTVLHPGEAGASLAAGLQTAGHPVGCLLDERSPASRGRATRLALVELATARDAADRSRAIVLACPPAAMAQTLRALRRFHGPVVAVGAMAPATARSVATAADEIGATFTGAAFDDADGELVMSGPQSPGVESLWAGSGVRTRARPELPAVAAPVLALLRVADLDGMAASPACPYVAEQLKQLFGDPIRSPERGTGPVTQETGLLRSLLRRPDATLTLEQQLTQWGIMLDSDESVSWFGACATEAGHCFLVLTQRRVWRVRSDGTAVEPPRRLGEIVSLTREGQRLVVTAMEWSWKIREPAGHRDLEDLRHALASASGVAIRG
jgi:hypothetical protein